MHAPRLRRARRALPVLPLLLLGAVGCASPDSVSFGDGRLGVGGTWRQEEQTRDGTPWSIDVGAADLQLEFGGARAVLAGYREGRELRWRLVDAEPPRWHFEADDRPPVDWQGRSLTVGGRELSIAPGGVLVLDAEGRPRAMSGGER